jgi:hypothetical protein
VNQLAIDFPPASHARRSDPATSKEAAARVREFAGGQCAQILKWLDAFRPDGAGAEQLATMTGLDAYKVRKRLADLHHAGLARPTDLTRRTESGRHERIWEAW